MKSYTDLEQSKKLAEILPLESADMIWVLANPDLPMIRAIAYEDSEKSKYHEILPAWSLSALLDILAKETHNIDEDGYVVLSSYKGNWWDISPINCISEEIKESNNPLDAAFEMVVWLKENKEI